MQYLVVVACVGVRTSRQDCCNEQQAESRRKRIERPHRSTSDEGHWGRGRRRGDRRPSSIRTIALEVEHSHSKRPAASGSQQLQSLSITSLSGSKIGPL